MRENGRKKTQLIEQAKFYSQEKRFSLEKRRLAMLEEVIKAALLTTSFEICFLALSENR